MKSPVPTNNQYGHADTHFLGILGMLLPFLWIFFGPHIISMSSERITNSSAAQAIIESKCFDNLIMMTYSNTDRVCPVTKNPYQVVELNGQQRIACPNPDKHITFLPELIHDGNKWIFKFNPEKYSDKILDGTNLEYLSSEEKRLKLLPSGFWYYFLATTFLLSILLSGFIVEAIVKDINKRKTQRVIAFITTVLCLAAFLVFCTSFTDKRYLVINSNGASLEMRKSLFGFSFGNKKEHTVKTILPFVNRGKTGIILVTTNNIDSGNAPRTEKKALLLPGKDVFALAEEIDPVVSLQPVDPLSESPFYWSSIDSEIKVLLNGDFQVTEKQSYVFNTDYSNSRFRWLPLDMAEVIIVEGITSNGVPLDYQTASKGNQLWVTWQHELNAPETHTFELSYTVKGAMRSQGDKQMLHWNIVFPDRQAIVKRASAKVIIPENTKGKKTLYYNFGEEAIKEQIDDRTMMFSINSPLLPGEEMGVDVRIPADVFTAPNTNQSLDGQLISNKREVTSDQQQKADQSGNKLLNRLGLFFVFSMIIALYIMYERGFGDNKKGSFSLQFDFAKAIREIKKEIKKITGIGQVRVLPKEKIISQKSQNFITAGELFSAARKAEDENDITEAEKLYQEIVTKFSDTDEAKYAKLSLEKRISKWQPEDEHTSILDFFDGYGGGGDGGGGGGGGGG